MRGRGPRPGATADAALAPDAAPGADAPLAPDAHGFARDATATADVASVDATASPAVNRRALWRLDPPPERLVGVALGRVGQRPERRVVHVWAVGAEGTALRWRGGSWQRVPTPTTETLRAVWGRGPGDVWVVGDRGTILPWYEEPSAR